MRVLMIGDVVGRPGRKAVQDNARELIEAYDLSLVIANGENAAGGMGITKEAAEELFRAGVDVLTMGNHVWDKREALEYIGREQRIVRPANFPPGTPGRGARVYEAREGQRVAVISLSGRVFMPSLDCPFRMADELIADLQGKADAIVVDFHAEATSEKMAFGWYLDGRVAAVCGTHTHVQTADERILPEGTAYLTDLGMTGPMDSVIGTNKDIVIKRFLTQQPVRMEVASGLFQLNGAVIEIDELSGTALSIQRVQHFE